MTHGEKNELILELKKTTITVVRTKSSSNPNQKKKKRKKPHEPHGKTVSFFHN